MCSFEAQGVPCMISAEAIHKADDQRRKCTLLEPHHTMPRRKMIVIMYLAIFMLLLSGGFLIIFLYALKKGQFQDLDTPAHKILIDDEVKKN